jgi:fructose-1,6-bisphosphatase/inositol monophosphatase family enzyme
VRQVTTDALRLILDEVTGAFRALAAGDVGATRKADGTLVTRVDLAVDRLLRERLLALAPDAAWLSEESAADAARLSSRWAWVVDPLDGTKELARGVPEYAISIGLVENGLVRAGGVVNPAADMGAITGTDGRWLQWPARVEPALSPASLNAATASISRTETEDGSIAPFVDLVGRVRHVGSVANKLMRVACGVEDLTFSVQPKWEWDLCGGVALLTARGLTFERLDRAPLRFNQPDLRVKSGFVAGPASLVTTLADQLRARLPGCHVGA